MAEKSNEKPSIGLRKDLNVLNCVSYHISMIIGAGIFIVPNGIFRDAGSVGAAFLIWIFGGIFSIFGALSYAELGCLIPKTGGEYEYLKTAFSDIFGFLFVWSYTFIYNPAVAAFAALLFSDYALKFFYPNCESPLEARLCLAAGSIAIMTMVNCLNVKLGYILGYIFNFGKIAGLLLIIAFGIYGLFIGRYESFLNPFENSATDFSKYALAFNAGCFAYGGWSSLNNLVGEMKNPNKTLPISIFTGLAIVVVIYLSTNVAYLTFLSPKEMMISNAVAFSFAEKLIGSFSWIVSIFVCLSALGFINGSLVSSSRQIFAAANNNHMPSVFALISIEYRTPVISVFFAGVLAFIYIFIKDMYILLNISMLLVYIFNQACIIALFWLRKTKPDEKRSFKVNLIFPIMFFSICFIFTVMVCLIYPLECIICVLFILVGMPVYYVCAKLKKPAKLEANISNLTIWTQKLTLSAFETKSN